MYAALSEAPGGARRAAPRGAAEEAAGFPRIFSAGGLTGLRLFCYSPDPRLQKAATPRGAKLLYDIRSFRRRTASGPESVRGGPAGMRENRKLVTNLSGIEMEKAAGGRAFGSAHDAVTEIILRV